MQDTPPPRQLWYLPVLAGAMALMMLRVLVMARLLDVPQFGTYSAGLLVSTTFCMLGCLGLYGLLQRDMPMLMARGRRRRAGIAMGQAALAGFVCLAALLPLAALRIPAAGLDGTALAVALVHGLSQQLFLVATVESRSASEPLRYAYQNMVRAIAVVAIAAIVAGATGSPVQVLAVEAAVSLAIVAGVLAHSARALGMRSRLLAHASLQRWKHVPWRTATVFLGISLVASLLASLDRWIAAQVLPAREFALYAFAAIAVLVAQTLQAMVNASVYPALARRFALEGPRPAFGLSARVSLGLVAAALVLAWPAHAIAGAAIERWYPAYAGAIPLLWPLIGVAIARVADFWSSYLVISGRERRLLALNIAVVVAGLVVWKAFMPGVVTPLQVAWLALLWAAGGHVATAIAAVAARGKA